MKKRMECLLSGLALLFFAAFIFSPAFTEQILKFLFSGETDLMYARAGLSKLLGEHTLMIVLSGSLASLTGIVLGIYVTRASGREYYPLVQSMASMAQTFPPTAVLALAVPVAGFGFKPVVIALFVYSIFPVINNTISGIEGISPSLTEASRGMGMTERQILFKTELPIAAKVIWAGIRTSTVINIGTATIGAVAGAGGLGRILIAGLIHDNLPYIFTGALSASLLAFFVDRLFAFVDTKLFSPQTNS